MAGYRSGSTLPRRGLAASSRILAAGVRPLSDYLYLHRVGGPFRASRSAPGPTSDPQYGRIHVRQRPTRYKTRSESPRARPVTALSGAAIVLNTRPGVAPCVSQGGARSIFPRTVAAMSCACGLSLAVGLQAGAGGKGRRVDADGMPVILDAALRHFYASWCINLSRRGQELPLKIVQSRLGATL